MMITTSTGSLNIKSVVRMPKKIIWRKNGLIFCLKGPKNTNFGPKWAKKGRFQAIFEQYFPILSRFLENRAKPRRLRTLQTIFER